MTQRKGVEAMTRMTKHPKCLVIYDTQWQERTHRRGIAKNRRGLLTKLITHDEIHNSYLVEEREFIRVAHRSVPDSTGRIIPEYIYEPMTPPK